MSHIATQEKLIFFPTKVPTPSFQKLIQCGNIHVIFLDREGKKKKPSLSNVMFCSSAKVKV